MKKSPAVLAALARGDESMRIVEESGSYPIPYDAMMIARRVAFVVDSAWAFASAAFDTQQRREQDLSGIRTLRFTQRNGVDRVHFRPSPSPLPFPRVASVL